MMAIAASTRMPQGAPILQYAAQPSPSSANADDDDKKNERPDNAMGHNFRGGKPCPGSRNTVGILPQRAIGDERVDEAQQRGSLRPTPESVHSPGVRYRAGSLRRSFVCFGDGFFVLFTGQSIVRKGRCTSRKHSDRGIGEHLLVR